MKNPLISFGVAVFEVSDNGQPILNTSDAYTVFNLDGLSITAIQDIWTNEFGAEIDALKQKLRARMVELGYDTVAASGTATAEQITAAKGLAKGKAKTA